MQRHDSDTDLGTEAEIKSTNRHHKGRLFTQNVSLHLTVNTDKQDDEVAAATKGCFSALKSAFGCCIRSTK